MKLMTLNTWGGRIKEPLFQFIKNHQDIDVFCFQELYNNAKSKMSDNPREPSLNILTELKELLPNHTAYFRPHIETIFGIATFVKNGIEVLEEGDVLIHHVPTYSGSGGDHSRNMQWVKCVTPNGIYTIMNVHGLWNGKGKTDTAERIAQSQRIRKFIDTIQEKKIICGDFNLRPDTESIKIISNGMIDLIATNNITSTRTSLYGKEEQFADYVFVSPDVTVNNFKVLPDEISDHSPLLLDVT